jgi:hypothetical protein
LYASVITTNQSFACEFYLFFQLFVT